MTDIIDPDDNTPELPADGPSRARIIEQKLMEVLAEVPPVDRDGEGNHYFPTRFVLISEWADLKGERWLAQTNSEGMEPWDINGFLREVVH